MSGKKKIAYPIELPFTIQEPILLNNAIDKYQLHKELIDQLLNALKGSFHKDMFRLVSAINKNAQIDLYIYIAATDNLKKIISDGVVGVNAARERFQENIDNHNINKPVMIVPLDIDFDLDTYDFSEAEKGYDEISREIQELEQKISWNKKKITVLNDKKKNADSEKAKIIKEEIKDLRNEKKHNQQELDELKNLYKISDEIEEI